MRAVCLFLTLVCCEGTASEPLSIKGIAIGTSAEAVSARFGGSTCNAERCLGSVESKTLPLDLATLADQPVKRLFVNFENGSTVGMVVTLGRESANAVMDALVSKFGNPQRTEQLFQTRGGLKTTQVTLLWTHGDHRLSVMSPMSRIDEMGVTLTSASFLRRFNSEKEKKASGDL